MLRASQIFPLVSLTAALVLAGCRTDMHTFREPVESQIVEVESGDRFWIELEENPTTGFSWEVDCDDFRRKVEIHSEYIEPCRGGEGGMLCGAPGIRRISVRVRLGFTGQALLSMKYRRPWETKVPPAREINFMLWKRDGDVAPWRD